MDFFQGDRCLAGLIDVFFTILQSQCWELATGCMIDYEVWRSRHHACQGGLNLYPEAR